MPTGNDDPAGERFVWCIRCGRAGRPQEWQANAGACPGCGAPAWAMYEWGYVRRIAPRLPAGPEPGHRYRLADYRD